MDTAEPKDSLLKVLDRFPPILCRLLARERNTRGRLPRPLTNKEIATQSGLDLGLVNRLSESLDWEEFVVRDVRAYIKGCNLRLDDSEKRKDESTFLRHRTSLGFLNTDPSQIAYFTKLITLFQNAK